MRGFNSRRILIGFINTLTNPAVIITAFGPLIIGLNIILLRNVLEEGHKLLEVLNDPATEAIREHSIQLYTLLLAVIIFQSIAIRWAYKVLSKGGSSVPWSAKLEALETKKLLWMVVLLGQLFGFAFVFFQGLLTTPGIVNIYTPETVAAGLHIPPLKSPITILRGVVGILAAIFHASEG